MQAIQFQVVVDEEQVIRPPPGVVLPQGVIEVTVQPVRLPAATEPDRMAPTRDWLLRMAAEAERLAPNLPKDLAEHHDHYAHGRPLS